ncbi:MAG: helix-turn-helix transcriptional regulator [Caulobacter sp.]|nr:helix-turn-helix transcriptional regulator [Caulobacter sp.]
MAGSSVDLLQDAETLRAALPPLRRALLERLAEPASASQLAEAMGMSRQKLGYHLRALEEAGLVRLVEERRRRGFTERVLVAAGRLMIDPALLAPPPAAADAARDRYAAAHLVNAAAGVVRDVTRMQAAADREDARLLTFTLEAEVALARPRDLEALTEALAEAVAAVVARFDRPGETSRRYRLIAGGHPAPKTAPSTARN